MFKKILQLSLISIFGLLLIPNIAFGADDILQVEFEKGNDKPLFDEANFLPGDAVDRWVKVKNVSSKSRSVLAKVENAEDPDSLGEQMNLTIKIGANEIFNNTLAEFFSQENIILSNSLGSGDFAQYDFFITFKPETGNNYQEKSLSFDIVIGEGKNDENGGGEGETVGDGNPGSGGIIRALSSSPSSSSNSVCGDGTWDVDDEECDDENTSNGDGCDEFCDLEDGDPELILEHDNKAGFLNPGQKNIKIRAKIKNIGKFPALNVNLYGEMPEDLVYSDNQSKNHSWPIGTLEAGREEEFFYYIDVEESAEEAIYTLNMGAESSNYKTIYKPTDIEIREPAVAGVSFELPETGFDAKEFFILFGLASTLIFSGFLLRFRYNR